MDFAVLAVDNGAVQPGTVLAGRFELERRAGAGGMGEVFRARDQATGEAVAIKVLLERRSGEDRRFAREASVLSELRHPSIVRYVAHGLTDTGEPYLAMEWLEGEDLSCRLRRGPLPVSEALAADDLSAVLERAERGVACGATGEDLGALRLCEAEAHTWRGELTLVEQRAVEATALLRPGSVGWFHAFSQALTATGKLGNVDRLGRIIDLICATPPEADAETARIICLCFCASYLIFAGRYSAADALIDGMERKGREGASLEAPAAAALAEARAFRASTAGDTGRCLESLIAAQSAFEQAGDRRNTCSTLANLGFTYAELGDFRCFTPQAISSAPAPPSPPPGTDCSRKPITSATLTTGRASSRMSRRTLAPWRSCGSGWAAMPRWRGTLDRLEVIAAQVGCAATAPLRSAHTGGCGPSVVQRRQCPSVPEPQSGVRSGGWCYWRSSRRCASRSTASRRRSWCCCSARHRPLR